MLLSIMSIQLFVTTKDFSFLFDPRSFLDVYVLHIDRVKERAISYIHTNKEKIYISSLLMVNHLKM